MNQKRGAIRIPLFAGSVGIVITWLACWLVGWHEGRVRAVREQAALYREVGVLRRQRVDWQADNPQRRDRAVAPGGYYVTTPAGTALRHADPWPSDDPHEVPVHPCLWPSTREALARWNLWARDHPDRAKKSLAETDRADLRAGRDDLRHALAAVEAALGERRAARPGP